MPSSPSASQPTAPTPDDATAPTSDPARAPTLHHSDRTATPSTSGLVLLAPPGVIPDPLKAWDHYELVRPLGQGGMGTVFLAKDRKLGRLVALKFLRVPSAEAAERLLQEARAQARLDHNHICKVFEVGEFQSQPYIAMEYIDGQPLHQVISRLSTEQKVLLIQQIALAVQSAHSQGILHRDLKPANIMVCEPKGDSAANGIAGLRPVLMDFGLARDSLGPQRLTQTGVIMGTPHYMAPEQARGMARHLDRRADVYSLGAMLYELLCGKPPFDAENEVDLLLAVLHQDPTEIRKKEPSIPIDLEVIVHKCLRKEPSQRYDSAQALSDDLGRYLRGEPILARPATTLYRLRRLAARHRAPVAIGTVVLASFLSLGGMWGQARAQRKRQMAQAAEQERLATQLGQNVTEMKLFLRVAYSLPPHDLRRDYEVVRQRLRKLEQQLKEADPFLHGTIESALGQGYLTLDQNEAAVAHLQRATELGENAAGTHLALAEALIRIYEDKQREISRQLDPEQAKTKIASLQSLYLKNARRSLDMVKQSDGVSHSYVEALLLRYAENPNPEAALQAARKAEEESPWSIEPLDQEFGLLNELSEQQMRAGRFFDAKLFDERQRALEQAITTVRSYPHYYQQISDLMAGRLRAQITLGDAPEQVQKAYEQGMKYAKTLKQLLPTDPTVADTQALIPAALAFAQGWHGQNPKQAAEEGLRALAEARKIQPERARTYHIEQMIHQAVAHYQEYNDLDPSETNHAAVKAAQKIAELAPEEAETWSRLALAESIEAVTKHLHGQDARTDMAKAIEHAERAIKLQPDRVLFLSNLGAFYLSQAQLARDAGDSPDEAVARGRAALGTALTLNPSFQLALENLSEIDRDEVEHLLTLGRDPASKLAGLRQHADQLLTLFPDKGEALGYALAALCVELKALATKQDVSAQLDALLARTRGPEFAAVTPGQRQEITLELELLRLQNAVRYKQSPESAMRAVLTVAPLTDVQKGGQKKRRTRHQVEGLRHFAEYLMQPQQKSIGNAPGIPRTPLAAVNAALDLLAPLVEHPSKDRAELLAEQAILLSLKAKLVPAAQRLNISQSAEAAMQEAVRIRPALASRLRPYQVKNPATPT